MKKILFICHGNICRSPMAEYIFKNMVRECGLENDYYIESAAVSREEIGNDIYPPAKAELTLHGIPFERHRARQMTREDYDRFDTIFVMDESNIRRMKNTIGEDDAHKVRMLLDGGIADPWYTGGFDRTYRDIVKGCENFLSEQEAKTERDAAKLSRETKGRTCDTKHVKQVPNNAIIRKSEPGDYERILEIYAIAREFMREHGNPNQWNTKWPPAELVHEDIEVGRGYVCEIDGIVEAAFIYIQGVDIDPTYRYIEDGSWLADSEYGAVHRIASSGNYKRIGEFCISWAYAQCGHLRMDTHGDNEVMQNLLTKLGFERRGIIYVVEDDYPRVAYEKI